MSVKRLGKFLENEELDPNMIDWKPELDTGNLFVCNMYYVCLSVTCVYVCLSVTCIMFVCDMCICLFVCSMYMFVCL